jgi:hypothetical protein
MSDAFADISGDREIKVLIHTGTGENYNANWGAAPGGSTTKPIYLAMEGQEGLMQLDEHAPERERQADGGHELLMRQLVQHHDVEGLDQLGKRSDDLVALVLVARLLGGARPEPLVGKHAVLAKLRQENLLSAELELGGDEARCQLSLRLPDAHPDRSSSRR